MLILHCIHSSRSPSHSSKEPSTQESSVMDAVDPSMAPATNVLSAMTMISAPPVKAKAHTLNTTWSPSPTLIPTIHGDFLSHLVVEAGVGVVNLDVGVVNLDVGVVNLDVAAGVTIGQAMDTLITIITLITLTTITLHTLHTSGEEQLRVAVAVGTGGDSGLEEISRMDPRSRWTQNTSQKREPREISPSCRRNSERTFFVGLGRPSPAFWSRLV